jgi:hypothetical protein
MPRDSRQSNATASASASFKLFGNVSESWTASDLLGVMISYQWPISGLWAIGTLIGVDFLFGGFSLIQLGSSAERFVR